MTVWGRITGADLEPPQTPRMRIGVELERPIAYMWAAQAGERIRMNSSTRTRGNLAATADGYCLDRGGLLEVKWSAGSSIWRGAELPESVYWQTVAQAAVYGPPYRVTVAALIGADLREWTIDPPREDRRRVIDEVDAFFARYIDRDPPEFPIPMYPAELDAWLRLAQGIDPEARRPATDTEQALAEQYLQARFLARKTEGDAEVQRRELLQAIALDPKPRIAGDGWVYTNANGRTLILDNGAETP